MAEYLFLETSFFMQCDELRPKRGTSREGRVQTSCSDLPRMTLSAYMPTRLLPMTMVD